MKHYHKCGACSTLWGHTEAEMAKLSEEAYAEAHKCPRCGAEQREKCGPQGEPWQPSPSELAAELVKQLLQKPNLILTQEAYEVILTMNEGKPPFGVEQRSDGMWRVPVSPTTFTTLAAMSLPEEDTPSATILRLWKEDWSKRQTATKH